MTELEPEEGGYANPVTPEELKFAESGKATPEQRARVRAALNDPDSPLSKWLQETEDWAKRAFGWRHLKQPEGKNVWEMPGISPAAQNFYRVIEYLQNKRKAGILSDEEVSTILTEAGKSESGRNPNPTPSDYAMGAIRIIRAISTRHPELASEAKSLPTSSSPKL
ncbi:MAG TPA: hypothetical protein VGG19_19915 [Tepidisphaeraceae bacterium]|jgi:hypothetical protein